ncbi:DUF5807 family protein [Halosegnis marinus]|uniref:DUF5807 family protein n=1 Tax=Halosegnis marinus TaxID=3034023 RepID=A0ABD5ZN82_9EURY|nr:DUF5807 family protein [Halosegnis sp. DT85]
MSTPYEAFLAGERHDDILLFIDDDAVGDPGSLAGVAEEVGTGYVLVLPGDRGSEVVSDVVGIDPMDLAGAAMDTEGDIRRDCTGGDCPAGTGDAHRVRFVFAFTEAENPEVGGLYAEGDVLHAYAACACGQTYSDKWVLDD